MSVRKDFAQAKADIELANHNSNMSNLAHADRRVQEWLEELEEKKVKALALQKKIAELAADPKLTSFAVREVYNLTYDLK